MSAPAVAGQRSVLIRGTRYPILLPTIRDPRLHLAAVIITLQVLGQTAFDFQLSIAQILVALITSAVLEVGIAFRQPARDHVAGQRAPDRQRGRIRPPRAGHRARRLVEHERRLDLRGDVGSGPAVEVSDPRSRDATSSTPPTSASCSAFCCSVPSAPTRSPCGGARSPPRSSSRSRSSSRAAS